MSLTTYKKKRHFKKTPEPNGRKTAHQGHSYVIQEHHARRLHYDFRLELDGTLKSWAVPKGPSLDPKVKRLAVEVEDHPVEYGKFEGVIPRGEYGAGEVYIWDKGDWEPTSDARKALKKGHLNFNLHGEKLTGNWNLVRTNRPVGKKNQWLLIKTKDDKAVVEMTFKPQLATLAKTPPVGKNWVHEIKFDGYRTFAVIKNKETHLLTRSGLDWSDKYPIVKNEIEKLVNSAKVHDLILDGEIVQLDETGRSVFHLLQHALKSGRVQNLVYFIFDILSMNGKDLKEKPLRERRKILEKFLTAKALNALPHLRLSQAVGLNGRDMLKNACAINLEGIVSKDLDQPYIEQRSKAWIKTKCHNGQEFVVVGFTAPNGARMHIGALLLAAKTADESFKYVGRVGTGMDDADLSALNAQFKSYYRDSSPLAEKIPDTKNVQWLEPKLVTEIEFRGWTADKILRQASFKGLRTDKPAESIYLETPTDGASSGSKFTNIEKVLIKKPKTTKGDLIHYCDTFADIMLPHIADRPLSLFRCPNGIGEFCFFQKNKTDANAKLNGTAIFEQKFISRSGQPAHFLYINNKRGLLELCQLATLEIHTWGTHRDHALHPDLMVFDLDPSPEVKWSETVDAALELRELLKLLNLESFLKLTGGKGLHLHVPVVPKYTWEQIKEFTHVVAVQMMQQNPTKYIDVMTKSKRTKKIFIDYLRIGYGATAIAPYSLRAREGAGVAWPIAWHEAHRVDPKEFNLPECLKKSRKPKNVWPGYFDLNQKVKILEK